MKIMNLISTTLRIIGDVLYLANQANELLSHELIRTLLFIIEVMSIC